MAALFLAPGASGNVAGLRAEIRALTGRGIVAEAISLPRGRAEAAVPAYRRLAMPSPQVAIGGHSFGGRVASLVAADDEVGALILISYPVHPPGQPERAAERTAHWPRITCPVLLLGGDRDPFARIDLLRAAVATLPRAELVIYPGLGHGIGPVLEDAMDRVAAFIRASLPAPGSA